MTSGAWISTTRDLPTKSIQNSLFVRRVVTCIHKFQDLSAVRLYIRGFGTYQRS